MIRFLEKNIPPIIIIEAWRNSVMTHVYSNFQVPPKIAGCNVFTRPPKISGVLVNSETRCTGIIIFCRYAAVPSEAMMLKSNSIKFEASSDNPVLSETLIKTENKNISGVC